MRREFWRVANFCEPTGGLSGSLACRNHRFAATAYTVEKRHKQSPCGKQKFLFGRLGVRSAQFLAVTPRRVAFSSTPFLHEAAPVDAP